MKGRTIDSRKVLFTALVCGFLATALLAQGSGLLEKGKVTKIEVAVWEPGTRNEIAQLNLGDTLELAPNQVVLLRLYAPRGHAVSDERKYLPARFYVTKGNGVTVDAVEPEKGLYRVTAANARGVAEIRYELGKGIAVDRPFMRDHFIKVEVKGNALAPPVTEQPNAEWQRAETVVDRLYRGILLREANLDNADGREWVERVYEGGYTALVEVAEDIVNSEESRFRVIERGHTPKDRLEAAYRHLLGLEKDQIDRYHWQDHFAMMARGGFADVVMDIVRSPEFRRVHGYN